MRIQKTGAACLACLMISVFFVLPASAHGRHHGHGCGMQAQSQPQQPAAVSVCTVEGCTLSGQHTHGGTAYCGYAHENGFCDGSCIGHHGR